MATTVPVLNPFPPDLADLLSDFSLIPITVGMSGSRVYQAGPYMLKTTSAYSTAEQEAERLRWLDGILPVPEVVWNDRDYLLMTRMDGKPLHELPISGHAAAELLGNAVRMWHLTQMEDRRYSTTNRDWLELVRVRVQNHEVDQAEFEEMFADRTPADLLSEAESLWQENNENTLIHGDFCMPNILFEGDSVVGFVDAGWACFGDPYHDLALAERSLRHNFGDGHADAFWKAYGIRERNERLMQFHSIVDELL